jgi:hypothetical protein
VLEKNAWTFIFDFALQSTSKQIPDTAGSLQLLHEDGASQFSFAPTGTSSFGNQTWNAGEIEDNMQRELHRWRDKV